MKCNETLSKWCKNKHGASKIMDTFETYQDTRFSTYDLSSICFIIVLALNLTIQDAYDGGNESSKLVSTIIFEGL
jgi:hypothetical protein